MNKSSMTSFNKITVEMDRLSQIINQQQIFQKQLQSQLQLDELKSDSSSSGIDNIDLYCKQYENPTAKSIPFGAQQELQSQFLDGDSETINIINRNKDAQQSEEGDKQNLHDDKSTVILANLKSDTGQEIKQDLLKAIDKTPAISPIYENNKSKNNKNDQCKKRINNVSERPGLTSMPSEIYTSPQHQKKINDCHNNSSHTKQPTSIGSPPINQSKGKKKIKEVQYLMSPIVEEQKGQQSKISKINRQQLNRLQQKKHPKKNQISTNRKKTKREPVNSKSTIILHTPKTIVVNNNLMSIKTSNSLAFKTSSIKKYDEFTKKSTDKLVKNQNDWQHVVQKVNKKLNKINISKYHDNIKKTHINKPLMKEIKHKEEERLKDKKINKVEEQHKNHQLKLHFTDQHETSMQILIDQKHIIKQYTKQTQKYLQIANKMSKEYFQIAMKQCRETSEEAIFKIKLVTLLLYFFDQFTTTPLINNSKSVDRLSDQFYTRVSEDEIIEVLLHPKKIMSLITNLPHILMSENLIAAERCHVFDKKFIEINDQLQQQLQFFLIKKTTLFMYIYSLWEYIGFLISNELISQTKRSKVAVGDSNQKMHGFYSNRSKRDKGHKKCSKKDRQQQFGLRCDSDRKIPKYDDQLCQKYLKINVSPKFSREQSNKKFYK